MLTFLKWLLPLLKVLLPVLIEQGRDTCEDGKGRGELEKRLWRKVKRDGWGKVVLPVLLIGCFLFSGCFNRTVYVPSGKAVRLRKPIKDAEVWELDKNNRPIESTRDLEEGWFVLPDEEEE